MIQVNEDIQVSEDIIKYSTEIVILFTYFLEIIEMMIPASGFCQLMILRLIKFYDGNVLKIAIKNYIRLYCWEGKIKLV